MKKVVILSLIATTSIGAMDQDDRKTEELAERTAEHRKRVGLLYDKWYSAPIHGIYTKTKWASVMHARRWAKHTRSRKDILPFIEKYDINVDEIAEPLASFQTFNDFFIRKLKPGARPLAPEKNAVISPADGAVLVMQDIGEYTVFPTKTVNLSIGKMLQNNALAKKFEGGTAYVVRLAEWDYHRFHFPLSGIPGASYKIKGRYESVSPLVYEAGIQPLEVNERCVVPFESDTASTMAIVLVGALYVGSIVETYTPGKWVPQGAEMGYFEFGGSTMVLLFKKGTVQVDPRIIKNSAQGKETPVKMGQLIGLTTSLRENIIASVAATAAAAGA